MSRDHYEEVINEKGFLYRYYPSEAQWCRNKTKFPDPDECSKYCMTHYFKDTCDDCKYEFWTCYSRTEGMFPNCCYGCFGYPICSCEEKHTGDCWDLEWKKTKALLEQDES